MPDDTSTDARTTGTMTDAAGARVTLGTLDAQELVAKVFPEDATKRDPGSVMRERVWYRNLLYYLGEQWLVFDETRGRFGRAYGGDPTIPTPVSDIIQDTVSSLLALTLNKRFITRVWPNSNELADRDAAEMGERVLEWLDARNDYAAEDVKELTELIRILTGNAFVRVYAASDDHWIFDAEGNRVPRGHVELDCVLPISVSLPPEGVFMRQKPWVGIQTVRRREWVEDVYGVTLPKSGKQDRGNIAFQKRLMQMISEVSSWKGAGLNTDLLGEDDSDLVMLREIEVRPCSDRPKGRTVIACEGMVLADVDNMPIPAQKDGRWDYSLVHFPYRRAMGSFWGVDAISNLISPQNIVNEIDQALAINRQSFGRPWVLTPAGLTLKRISDRASKILALEYDPATTAGSTPEIHHGTPYPDQVLKEREQQRIVAQEVAGDPKNVLRGQPPSSSASGIMVDILRETAEQSHVPDIMRFYRAWNKVNRLRLTLAKDVYKATTQIKIKGKGNDVLVKEFRGSDLRDNTDVRFELDSGAASTNAGRNATLLRLVEAGFWGDIAQRPDIRSELLRRIGLSGFRERDNVHRTRAQLENSILAGDDKDLHKGVALPDPNPVHPETGAPLVDTDTGKPVEYPWPASYDPVFEHDPHELHLEVHDEFLFGREFRGLDNDAKQRLLAHRDMHYQVLLQQMEAQLEAEMLQQGAMQGNAGPQGSAQATPQGGGPPPASASPSSPAASQGAPGGGAATRPAASPGGSPSGVPGPGVPGGAGGGGMGGPGGMPS